MVQPLITEDVRDKLYKIIVHNTENKKNVQKLVAEVIPALKLLDEVSFNVLKYLLFHLKIIAEVKGI